MHMPDRNLDVNPGPSWRSPLRRGANRMKQRIFLFLPHVSIYVQHLCSTVHRGFAASGYMMNDKKVFYFFATQIVTFADTSTHTFT